MLIGGLFTKIPGYCKNLPVVRTGNVALMPDPGDLLPGVEMTEPTPEGTLAKKYVNAEVYLVEARSIGGLSGSPAFVRASTPIRVSKDQLAEALPGCEEVGERRCYVTGPIYLLGLVHGHWDIPAAEKNEMYPQPPILKGRDVVNMGFAVIVPARKIREVLYHPGLVEERQRADEKRQLELVGTTTPDSPLPS